MRPVQSQLPHEDLVVDLLLGVDCSPEFLCQHNSHMRRIFFKLSRYRSEINKNGTDTSSDGDIYSHYIFNSYKVNISNQLSV